MWCGFCAALEGIFSESAKVCSDSSLAPPPTLSASLPRKWHLSKARAHERGSHEHQAPLPCEVPQSQSWLVDLRRGGAKIQGGRSVEPSRSPVPNPAINSLLVHVVDLH